ncbi:MAG: hypothetical protein WAQ98_10330 [Blastocatellia bacterium]
MRVFFLFTLLGMILFNSCAYFPHGETGSKEIQIPETTENQKTDPRLESGQQLLKQGKYKEAIVEFEAVLKADPSSQPANLALRSAQKKLKEEREKTVQSLVLLNESGLQSYHREEYLKAGLAWKETLDLFRSQNDPTLERELPFQIEEVTIHLNQLIRVLVDKGVLLYRQGELQNAVYAWQDVLSVEPEHVEAKDYIHKARVKMETLETLSPPPSAP